MIKITRSQKTSEESFVHSFASMMLHSVPDHPFSSSPALIIRSPRGKEGKFFQTVEQFMKLKFRSMVHYSWRWKKGEREKKTSIIILHSASFPSSTSSFFPFSLETLWTESNRITHLALLSLHCGECSYSSCRRKTFVPVCVDDEHSFMQIRINCKREKTLRNGHL